MKLTQALERYLTEVRNIHLSGAAVPETSYYGPLATLLNEIGKTLKPKVHCIINPANQGVGIPDGGLYSATQIPRATGQALPGCLPAFGAIECKPATADVHEVAATAQVRRYVERYGQVLVTNFRDFVLVGRDELGKPSELESYHMAETEAAFWTGAAHPRTMAEQHGERLGDYLKRVMLSATPVTNAKDLAWYLASYAREAKARVEAADVRALEPLQNALEQSLGLTFEGERGARFFRATLVQTLFYGIFAAWVLWAREHPRNDTRVRFDWRSASWSLHVPMIRAMFGQVAQPAALTPLDLVEVLDWTGAALNRVDRVEFFAGFEENHAVQYFYEPFLEAYDPELRKELGVWYTPPEIVHYMVERVDRALREELGIPDGLADPCVYVLDPCCGTGAYVVEVLRRIECTLRGKGEESLVAADLRKAAIERVFGFEILPAPFVVAHLQIGLLLHGMGAPLADDTDRAGVFLTNALTGWEPPQGPKQKLPFAEFEQERDAADKVKQEKPILVILGNPPYNGFAGMAVAEERDLSTAYRTTKRAPAPQGQGLNDLYVRFFRMAERRIVEKSGKGVVCFISNYSWLDGLSFTGMRERYLEVFDSIRVDCMNGDKYKTGKLTPDREPDPSVFSTPFNKEGIQVGTAITLLTRSEAPPTATAVEFRHFWGRTKREDLVASLASQSPAYELVDPPLRLGLPFMPATVGNAYLSWPLLPELFPVSFPGIQPGRDDVVVAIDRARLVERMETYFDKRLTNEEVGRLVPGSMDRSARYDPEATRDLLCRRGLLADNFFRHLYRPFDQRWLYWEPETKLLDEKRADYVRQVRPSNVWLAAAQRHRKGFDPPFVTRLHCSRHIDERGANLFPFRLGPHSTGDLFAAGTAESRANLSADGLQWQRRIGAQDTTDQPFYHAASIMHSPRYATENAGALRQDWPRIPLPGTKELLEASAALGRQVADLLDTETAVPGVTTGAIREEMKGVGAITRDGGGALDPNSSDLAVTAGWGHRGQGGVTMPASGRLTMRDYTLSEREAIEAGAAALNMDTALAFKHLGESCVDVWLNDVAYWRCVPVNVWKYTIGGYQVMKKWLSYREQTLLGRSLSADEAREVTNMARRIAAILLLQPALDANYQTVKANTYPWPGNGNAVAG